MLSLFDYGNGNYEFWAKTNMPKVIKMEKYLLQKIQYLEFITLLSQSEIGITYLTGTTALIYCQLIAVLPETQRTQFVFVCFYAKPYSLNCIVA
ncbi:MAG: hypothetical protein A2W74_01195 [Planctomycetes bacterium RIFCSPLOWO2_12_38_17]|nr:MAG: hypothetical protein A2W74_01195 [Planctomycetes bacterium RIFCSPLOWO2_12_38_17]